MPPIQNVVTGPDEVAFYGESAQNNGVLAYSSATGHSGVAGVNDAGTGNGVYGRSARSDGVIGITSGDGKAGVAGVCDTGNGNGVYGRSEAANGVAGYSSAGERSIASRDDRETAK